MAVSFYSQVSPKHTSLFVDPVLPTVYFLPGFRYFFINYLFFSFSYICQILFVFQLFFVRICCCVQSVAVFLYFIFTQGGASQVVLTMYSVLLAIVPLHPEGTSNISDIFERESIVSDFPKGSRFQPCAVLKSVNIRDIHRYLQKLKRSSDLTSTKYNCVVFLRQIHWLFIYA